MSVSSQPRSRAVTVIEIALILVPIVGYAYVTCDRLWTPPSSADPQNYLQPVLYHDMTLVSYPDRLMVSLDMFLTDLLGRPLVSDVVMRMGAFHPMVINTLTLLVAAFYCYRVGGLAAGVLCTILLGASYNFLRYSNDVYPDVDLTLYTVLAGALLLSNWRRNWLLSVTTLCGFFCAMLALCKPTAAASLGVVVVYLFALRRSIVSFIVGGILGGAVVALLCLAAFDYESIGVFLANVHDQIRHAVHTMTFSRAGVDVSVYDSVVWVMEFPVLLAPFVATRLWQDRHARFWFALAITHLLLLALLIGLSNTLRSDNYIYYHTAVACAAIGLSIGLVGQFARKRERLELAGVQLEKQGGADSPPTVADIGVANPRWPLSLPLLILGVAACWAGLYYPEFGRAPSGADTPVWFRTLFATTPLALLTLLLATNLVRASVVARVLALGLVCWAPYITMARVTDLTEATRHRRRLTTAFAREAERIRRPEFAVAVADWARSPDRYTDDIERTYDIWWGEGFRRAPASGGAPRVHLVYFRRPDDVLTSRELEFVVSDADAWEALGERQRLFKLVREWNVENQRFVTLLRVDRSFIDWTMAADSAALLPTLHGYSFKDRKPDAVKSIERTEEQARFELAEAGDVRIVTGAGPYNRKPRESALTLPPGPLRVKLAGTATDSVRVARVTLVFGDEKGEVTLLTPEFRAGRAFSADVVLLPDEIPAGATTLRVMLHVHGTGELTIREMEMLREAGAADEGSGPAGGSAG
ncbi:MAG: hypothetical protein KDA32_08675 [Phycisphaerales bacterium]|nr:hypothetical protein [Phycisphaerales bacterium]